MDSVDPFCLDHPEFLNDGELARDPYEKNNGEPHGALFPIPLRDQSRIHRLPTASEGPILGSDQLEVVDLAGGVSDQ
jgi:hypothetical protein